MTYIINYIINWCNSGWAVYYHLQRLVSVVGRTRGKHEDLSLLRPRVRQRRPLTKTLSCSNHLRRDRGGTSQIQHSSVTKCLIKIRFSPRWAKHVTSQVVLQSLYLMEAARWKLILYYKIPNTIVRGAQKGRDRIKHQGKPSILKTLFAIFKRIFLPFPQW